MGSVASARLRWLFFCALAAAQATGLRAGEPARPRLCVEYFPGIVYEDEPISICTRVEAGEGAPATVSLTASLSDGSGQVLASETSQGTPAAEAPWRHESQLRPGRGSPARLDLRLASATGEALTAVSLRVLDGRAPLPRLKVDGAELADETGQRAIVRIEHRVRTLEQRWPLLRWLRYKIYGDRWEVHRALLIGEDLGAPKDGYLDQVAAGLKGVEVAVVAVPSEPGEDGSPALRAVAALPEPKPEAHPDLAVLCLGHCELDLGTDVLQFGRALELLIQQLERQGCEHFVLVAPVGPAHLARRLAPYAKAVERVAHTYQARFVDIRSRMTDGCWVEPETTARVVLRLPSATGQKAIAEALGPVLAKCWR